MFVCLDDGGFQIPESVLARPERLDILCNQLALFRLMFRISRRHHQTHNGASGMSKYALRRSTLALTISTLLAAESAAAATITVTTTADGPIGTISGCSLRAAIASANNGNSQGGCASGSIAADIIVFDGSLAQSTITLSEGPLDITDSLTITGPVADDSSGLVIDGDNLSRIFNIQGPSDTSRISATIENMALTRGRATGSTASGGAIDSRYVNLTLNQTLITGNSVAASVSGKDSVARAYGGGLSVVDGSVTVANSVITGNSLSSQATGQNSVTGGGGIRILRGSASIIYSTVTNNQSLAYVSDDNSAGVAFGGGLAITAYDSSSSLVFIGSSISGNLLQAETNDVDSNSFATGGGIHVVISEGQSAIVDSAVADNWLSANYSEGGGILNAYGELMISNSTISGNAISGEDTRGGGIALRGNESTPGSLAFKLGTLAFNTASNGNEGIHQRPGQEPQITLELEASLLVQGNVGETACNAAADTANFSLATDASCTGSATALGDIKLTGLSDNGGPTLTHGLLPGSVAIDAVSPCLAEPVLDQRGLPRPGGTSSACDIGALEVQQEDDFDALFRDRFEQ
jgi:CSLREA domain-containing protein